MTRKIVYAGALVPFIAVFATTIASIVNPRWITWDEVTPSGKPIHYTYGLHLECSSSNGCSPFPDAKFCHEDRDACSMWRSVGFLMSFAVVVEGMTFIAFMVMLVGSIQKRALGKNVICSLLLIIGAIQAIGMGIISFLFEHDERFFPGWKLDAGYMLCTASWVVSVMTAGGILVASNVLPIEGDYELIPDRVDD